MKKYMIWLISVIMAVSMTACSNPQKKDTKDQAQVTTAAKENDTVLMLDALESGISEYLTMLVPEEYFAGKKVLVQ